MKKVIVIYFLFVSLLVATLVISTFILFINDLEYSLGDRELAHNSSSFFILCVGTFLFWFPVFNAFWIAWTNDSFNDIERIKLLHEISLKTTLAGAGMSGVIFASLSVIDLESSMKIIPAFNAFSYYGIIATLFGSFSFFLLPEVHKHSDNKYKHKKNNSSKSRAIMDKNFLKGISYAEHLSSLEKRLTDRENASSNDRKNDL